jgi:hypothetical protein
MGNDVYANIGVYMDTNNKSLLIEYSLKVKAGYKGTFAQYVREYNNHKGVINR